MLAILDELVHTRATFPDDGETHGMTSVRIENATHLVTVNASDEVLTDATIDDRRRRHHRDHAPRRRARPPATGDATVIDARGKLVMPGLVNLHTHLPMTLLRGLAENLDLQGFLEHLWAAEAAVMDPESVELGATLGALESLLAGCTTQLDMYFHHEAAHRGAVAAGSRHVIGPVFFDGPGPDGLAWPERLANLRAWPGLLDEIGGPAVPVAAMPHATYTCSPEGLTEVVATLRKVLADTGRPGLLTTHVSENPAENAGIRERFDATPTELLARTGWLEPDLPFVLGHGVHLTAGDRALVAAGRRRHRPLPRVEQQARQRCPALGRRCATAASGSVWAPTAARAPTTSTCGRRCARPPCSPGSRAAAPTSRAPPRCCAPRPSRAPAPWAWAT